MPNELREDRVAEALRLAENELSVEELEIILKEGRPISRNQIYVMLNRLAGQGLAEGRTHTDQRKRWKWLGDNAQNGVVANLNWATDLLARNAAARIREERTEVEEPNA